MKTLDSQLIHKLDAITNKYVEATNNHDAAAIGALYTDDAIFVTDTGPLYGSQAIEKWHMDLFNGWQPKNRTTTIDPDSVRMLGQDNLTDSGDWSETGRGNNGEDVPAKGYWSAILTHQGDAWKICALTWNVTPAPPAPAQAK